MMLSSGTSQPAERARAEVRLALRRARRRPAGGSPVYPLRRAFSAIAGQRRDLLRRPGDEQRAGALDRDAGAAARTRAAAREPRRSRRLSRLPGVASNPVCRIAVLALDVPVPTSSAASTSDAAQR